MSKALERSAEDAKRSHEPAHRHPVPDAGPSAVELERHKEEKHRPRVRRSKYIQPLPEGDTGQDGDPTSNDGINTLVSSYPSPSEGQGIDVDEDDILQKLIDDLANMRSKSPDRFDRALGQMGFVAASSIVTQRGWVKTSALPDDLAAKRLARDAKRQRNYIANLSPEKAAARHTNQMASQRARRLKKRESAKPT